MDECIDWRLSRDLAGHKVKTARQMGWTAIKNGKLLALAAQEFDAFVTVDRNLSFQQNTVAFDIAIIILRAKSNRLAELRGLLPSLRDALASANAGTVTKLGANS